MRPMRITAHVFKTPESLCMISVQFNAVLSRTPPAGLKPGPAGLVFSLHSTDGPHNLFVYSLYSTPFLLHCALISVCLYC